MMEIRPYGSVSSNLANTVAEKKGLKAKEIIIGSTGILIQNYIVMLIFINKLRIWKILLCCTHDTKIYIPFFKESSG